MVQFFISMQFSGNFGRNNRLALPCGWYLLWKILDPPLILEKYSKSKTNVVHGQAKGGSKILCKEISLLPGSPTLTLFENPGSATVHSFNPLLG